MKMNYNFLKDLPVFLTLEDLRNNINVEKKFFYKVLFNRKAQYKMIKIPKRNCEQMRILDVPSLPLKRVQRWILENILYTIPVKSYVHGFVPGRSIVTNAFPHLKAKYILKMDIKDYFPSIHFGIVKKFFCKIGYPLDIANALASICCYNSHLPQGAPTSPYLANLICEGMDIRIQGLCQKHNLIYTRYADDITISGSSNVFWIKNIIKKIVESYSFQINEEKTLVVKPGERKRVTGIIVNEKLSIPKGTIRELRKNIYYIKKFGIEDHLKRIDYDGVSIQYISRLYGIISFIKMIDLEKGLYYRVLLDSALSKKSTSEYNSSSISLDIDWSTFDEYFS